MKRLIVLGSTGSVGRNTLDVVARLNRRFRIAGLSCNRNIRLLAEQARRFKVKRVAIQDKTSARRFARIGGLGRVRTFSGPHAAAELIRHTSADVTLTSIVGAPGLLPVIEAVRKGQSVAIANKEPLVMAGELVTRLARKTGAVLLPVDSEHSAIFQCLNGTSPERIRRLLLTGTGGPFLRTPQRRLRKALPREAVRHPKWRMGKKISVDSSTLMNKGLEVIEAQWLFDVPTHKIEVIIHPEALIHSMVEFVDGSVLAQLGLTDMRIPIQYALTYPDRLPSSLPQLDFVRIRSFSFERPDVRRFPCLDLACSAARQGGTAPAVLNAANEVAVEAFLKRKISYPDIARTIERVMKRHRPVVRLDLGRILEADHWAREEALRYVA